MIKSIQHKIVSKFEDARQLVEKWRSSGNKIVFTNGCFDLLHIGHLYLLDEAKQSGDQLIVGLNDDQSVKQIKGPGRPIKNQEQRAMVLAALEFVDLVVYFREETPLRLIQAIKPDVLVKGGDWQEDQIVGGSFVKSYGGLIHRVEYIENHSTTEMVKKITNQG